MSDDEADLGLLELLRQSLGISKKDPDEISSDTGVLKDAEFIYNNAIDVSVDMIGTRSAAMGIYQAMNKCMYSADDWRQHELHPKPSEGFSEIDLVNFVFTMDLLNFSFWSALPEEERFQVEYRGRRWTGYNSLVACLRRALDGGVPITTPRFWRSEAATDDAFKLVFFSATDEEIPLLKERIEILREAGQVLHENFCEPEENDTPVANAGEAPSVGVNTQARSNAESVDVDQQQAQPRQTYGDTSAERPDNLPNDSDVDLAPVSIESAPEPVSETAREPAHEAAQLPSTTDDKVPSETTVPTGTEEVDNQTDEAVATPRVPVRPDLSVVRLIEKADHSAGKLVNLLAKHFPSFRDEARFDGRRVRLMKRAQILVADLWAALNRSGYGEFHDIEHLTMFADYRLPQMLQSLGVLSYSPPLTYRIRDRTEIAPGHSWEVQLRGCSIWAVELMRREMVREHPEAQATAALIDFFLYDLAKEQEKAAEGAGKGMPHHRTRSIWY